MSCDALLARIARSDRDAFDVLYDAFSPKLYAVCIRVLGHGAEADESLQNACVKIWRHADQWPGTDGTALAWLLAIARHTAIDHRRGTERRARHMDGLAEGGDVLPVVVPEAHESPETAAARASDAAHLVTCLDALPEERASVIRRAYFSGDSYAEIASETGHPTGTLKSWVHRSLAALRTCLEGRGVGGAS